MVRDAQRVEAHKQQLREAKDRSEREQLPFKPAVHNQPAAYAKVESVLSQRNLSHLVARLKNKQSARESEQAAARVAKENDAQAKCTFKPHVNVVPSYIADMAKSAFVLRGALVAV